MFVFFNLFRRTQALLHFIVNVLFFCGAKLSIINNLMGIFNFNFYEFFNQ